MSATTAGDRLDDVFTTLFELRPVDASFVGHHRFDGTLPDFGAAGIARHCREIDRLAALFPLDETSRPLDAAEIDRRVASGYLASQQALLASDHAPWRDPSVLTGLAVLGVIGLLRRDFAPASDRMARAMDRVWGLPGLLEAAATAAETAPGLWRDTAAGQCRAGAALCRDGLPRFCADHGLPPPDAEDCRAAALAFDRLGDALRQPAAPDARRPVCGRALLDLLLETTHHIAGGSATVEAIALAEFETARAALEGAALPGRGGWQRVLAETQGRLVPRDEVLARHRALFEAHRALIIERGLLTWPDYPLTFRETPAWLQGIMPAAGVYPYHAAAPLDPDVEVDFIIPDAPQGTPAITILSNHVLHHAGAGHHVQNWFAYNRARTRFGRLSAVDSAGYILIQSGIGMAEGWASYVPEMVAEFGIADEDERLCISFDRLRAATRALVDVRFHGGVWSVDEAAEFLVTQTGAAPKAAIAAVQRISHAPGSGSMYCVGPAILRHLRRLLTGDRPAAADLGRFHDAFLSFGSLPLPLVAEAMTGSPAADFLQSMPRVASAP